MSFKCKQYILKKVSEFEVFIKCLLQVYYVVEPLLSETRTARFMLQSLSFKNVVYFDRSILNKSIKIWS